MKKGQVTTRKLLGPFYKEKHKTHFGDYEKKNPVKAIYNFN